jgi:DNA recombination protein RmuC
MNTSKADAEKHCNELLEAKDKACKDALAAQETRHKESIDNLQERFDVTMKKVSAEMKTATDEMLKQRQKEFADASNTNLGQIVNPLRETIDKMKAGDGRQHTETDGHEQRDEGEVGRPDET